MIPKTIGHQTPFPKTLKGLFLKGCWEIPEIMASSFMALIGMSLSAVGLYKYYTTDGDNREYKSVYVVIRPDDPRACRIKNPVYTSYKQ